MGLGHELLLNLGTMLYDRTPKDGQLDSAATLC